MFRQLRMKLRYDRSSKFNKIIYYLKKIPLLGKLFPSSLYGMEGAKLGVQLLQGFLGIIQLLLMKILYYAALMVITFYLLDDLFDIHFSDPTSATGWLLLVLLYFSGVLGMIMRMPLFNPGDDDEIALLKIIRMNPKIYYLEQIIKDALIYLLVDGLIVSAFFHLFTHSSWLIGWTLIAFLTGYRLLVSRLTYNLYDIRQSDPMRWLNYVMFIYLFLGILATGVAIWLQLPKKAAFIQFFDSTLTLGMSLLVILLGIILWVRVDNFQKLASRIVSVNAHQKVIIDAATVESASVKVDAKDLALDEKADHRQTVAERKTRGQTFLNQLFFKRVGHLLHKKVRRRTLATAALMAVLIFATWRYGLPNKEVRQTILENFNYLFVIMVLSFSYIFYIGNDFMKFCFYHMDRLLMRYNTYRQPAQIFEALRVRVKYALFYNLPIFLTSVLGLTMFSWLIGQRSISTLLGNIIFQALAMLFFTYHYLVLYYLIQPFSENMSVKSVLYKLINNIIYIVIFFVAPRLVKLSHLGLYIALFIVVYLLISAYLIKKLAPKRFKLRH